MMQLVKTAEGIKVRTDNGEEIEADVVLFATGNSKVIAIDMDYVVLAFTLPLL